MRSCSDCKYYNDSCASCTKDYGEMSIMDEDETGSNCMEFERGTYIGSYREFNGEEDEELEENYHEDDENNYDNEEEEEEEEFDNSY